MSFQLPFRDSFSNIVQALAFNDKFFQLPFRDSKNPERAIGEISFQLPFRDSLIPATIGALRDITFNSLFGIP